MVRNMRAVQKTGFYGTEGIFGAQNSFLGYATHFQKPSVLKTGFCGTEGIFGTGNALLRYGVHLQSAVPSLFRLTRVYRLLLV